MVVIWPPSFPKESPWTKLDCEGPNCKDVVDLSLDDVHIATESVSRLQIWNEHNGSPGVGRTVNAEIPVSNSPSTWYLLIRICLSEVSSNMLPGLHNMDLSWATV